MAFIPGLSLNKIIEGLRSRSTGEIQTVMVRDIIQGHPDFLRISSDETKTGFSDLIMVNRDPSFWNQPYMDFVFSLSSQIADALAYAHKNRICHGDLKPSNIILSAGGVPMLVDFGLAKDMRSLSSIQSAEFLGTMAYASPEHLARNTMSEKSDIWSLGLTMYEMITLRQPFRTEDVANTLRRIEEFEPRQIRSALRAFPKDAEAVVFKCLEKSLRSATVMRRASGRISKTFLPRNPLRRGLSESRAGRSSGCEEIPSHWSFSAFCWLR